MIADFTWWAPEWQTVQAALSFDIATGIRVWSVWSYVTTACVGLWAVMTSGDGRD